MPFGRRMAAQTKQELETNGQREEYLNIKDTPNQDRVIQLVIIGVDVDKNQIEQLLDNALVSDM